MEITVFGATGKVGQRVVSEALFRGHKVTAVIRNPNHLEKLPAAATVRFGDAANIEDVVLLSTAQDVVINATRSATSDPREVMSITQTMMDGLAQTGARLLVVGGAASLKIPGTDNRMVIDDPNFLPASARHIGQASFAQFEACLAETRVDWAYLSPPADLIAGERTGQYRLGRDELLLDSQGKSTISIEDLAVVLLDEAETPTHHQTQFTAAY